MKKILKNLCLITVSVMFLVSCETMTGTQKGAAIGTGVGAGTGAAIGALAGNAGIGAGVGATAGLLLGGLAGSQSDKKAVQNVTVYINNKDIGTFNINDSQGYSQVATIMTENKGVAVISGPISNIIKEKLLSQGLKNSQVLISERGNYNNTINISF
jgi:hypothetical protein